MARGRITRRAWGRGSLALLAAAGAVGCEDKQELANQLAPGALEHLLPLLKRDTEQIRTGLPKGAAILSKHLDERPEDDREAIFRAMKTARSEVKELAVAKGSFFVFVAPSGLVLRGESEPDLAADHSLTEAIPDAKALLRADAGLKETWGYMEGLRGVNKGDDIQWVVGHPVEVKDKFVGTFVTGFSLRFYAKVLEYALNAHMRKQMKDPKKPPPLTYPFIIKGGTAYGGPVTPDTNMESIASLDLVNRAKDQMTVDDIEIDGRKFRVVGKTTPVLAPDTAIAVSLSGV
ncbi:MAG: hypothetical protein AAGA56_09365 [Myxococcota bacterium]